MDVADTKDELIAKIEAGIKRLGETEADYTCIDSFLNDWDEVVASAFCLGRPDLVEGQDSNIPRLNFACESLAHKSIRDLIRKRLVTVLDRIDDPPATADPISFSDIAILANVNKKSVANYAVKWRKQADIPPICSYGVIRPFLLGQWPDRQVMFPPSYSEMRAILQAHRENVLQSSTV